MHVFYNQSGQTVRLTFGTASREVPHDVLCFPIYGEQLVCTVHSVRGIELPGGKIELGETADKAIHREVFEECAVKLERVTYIGEYEVAYGEQSFVKAIYVAHVSELLPMTTFMETEGRVLVPLDCMFSPEIGQWSEIMLDGVAEMTLAHLKKYYL
ncbi:MAG: NUDIX domain-containing protein [Bacilli bacterium]